ncbi:GNAT domain-containing protein [Aspergillus egyptiacus]|nr:GNAT domain-containing protein [Aspergillus egyptiacus]
MTTTTTSNTTPNNLNLSHHSTQFQTPRLILTSLSLSDAPALHELRTEPEVMKWTRQKRPDKDIQETEAWIAKVLSAIRPFPGMNSITESGAQSNSNSSSSSEQQQQQEEEEEEEVGVKGCQFAIRELSQLRSSFSQNPEVEIEAGAPEAQVPDRIIGTLGIGRIASDLTGRVRYEIGYLVLPRVWGRGYASEAVRGVMGWFFDLLARTGKEHGERGQEAVYAIVAKSNAASLRVMEKCGFVAVGEGVAKDGVEVVEFCCQPMGKSPSSV